MPSLDHGSLLAVVRETGGKHRTGWYHVFVVWHRIGDKWDSGTHRCSADRHHNKQVVCLALLVVVVLVEVWRRRCARPPPAAHHRSHPRHRPRPDLRNFRSVPVTFRRPCRCRRQQRRRLHSDGRSWPPGRQQSCSVVVVSLLSSSPSMWALMETFLGWRSFDVSRRSLGKGDARVVLRRESTAGLT
jgi:hypothetical protein